MNIINIFGWLLYIAVVLYTVSMFAYIWSVARAGGGVTQMGLFQWAFSVTIVIIFGLTDIQKLHILWLAIVGYIISFTPFGRAIGQIVGAITRWVKIGFFIMLAVTLVVFFVLKGVIGILGATMFSIILLVGWFMFNFRAATTGLIKANMRAYFVQRSRGASHEDAMDRVIRSRYPFSQEKQAAVKTTFDSASARVDEKDDLENLIYIIFCLEAGMLPPPHQKFKLLSKINNIYDSMSRQYGKKKWKN